MISKQPSQPKQRQDSKPSPSNRETEPMDIAVVSIGNGRYCIFFEYEDGTVDFMEIS